MTRYQSRPTFVTAVQWNAHGDHAAVTPWAEGSTSGAICSWCAKPIVDHGWFNAAKGTKYVCPGSYIVTNGAGETFCLRAADFAEQYVAVTP